MPTETQYIQILEEHTIQDLPSVKKNGRGTGRLIIGQTSRGPLLPAYGTREREYALLLFYRNDYNGLYRSALGGLIKRVQSTPWEIQGEQVETDWAQRLFMEADFGNGWDTFVAKIIKDYNRYDGGAYIEVIGRGDPMQPLFGAPLGLAVLDSLRCYPTGDPEFPVIYMDYQGQLHNLHFTRVIRFYDMQDTDDSGYGQTGYVYGSYKGYGECSLSRGISAVSREILQNRYVEQELDDNPKPGLLLFKNIAERQLEDSIAKMEQERETDSRGRWGHTVKIFGLDTSQAPEVQSVSYSNPPEKFDFETYKNINAKEIAAAIGIDIQDFWELTSSALGSGTQSEIMAEKSKGNALGHTLKELERSFNKLLPDDMEFTFKYRDAEEDQQEADKATAWTNTATFLVTNGLMNNEQAQRLLANQVGAIADVITDERGEVVRLPDDDPKSDEQETIVIEDVVSQTPEDSVVVEDKALRDTQMTFRNQLVSIASQVTTGDLTKVFARQSMRTLLQTQGENVFLDGLRDGGMEMPQLGRDELKEVTAWRSRQIRFMNKFIADIAGKDLPQAQLVNRAQMWVNKTLNTLYFTALNAANPNQRWLWVVDPSKEHCVTCLRLNGQIHRMKDYVRRGLVPNSRRLACGGYKCGCDLKKTDIPARGNFRAVRFVRG